MAHDAYVLVNAHSRRGRAWYSPAVRALEQGPLNIAFAHAYKNADQLVGAAREAVAKGVPRVIVGGGDGTISSIVGAFVGQKSVLGILPLGTGNMFARDLGIPSDVQAACSIVAYGKPRPVDLGIVGDEYFINVATVGLTTKIAEALTGNQKRTLGRAAYLVALVRGVFRLRRFTARLEIDEGVREFSTIQVVVGNGRFHAGPFPLAPDASITDGKLNVYAVANASPMGLLRLALHLPSGRHVHLDEVPAFTTSRLRLTTEPSKRVTIDGEISARTPIEFGIAPAAIQVMTPAEFKQVPTADEKSQ